LIGTKVPALALLAAMAMTAVACAAKDNGGAFGAPPSSTGPAPPTDPAAARLLPATFQASHQLKAGVDPSHPPLAFLQGSSVQGLDEDLIQAIGAKLGLRITLVQGVPGDQVDVLLPGPPSRVATAPPAAQVVPFLRIGLATVVKAGTSSCAGPVAVVPDVPFPACLGPHVPVATPGDAVAALQQGRVNALVTDYATAVYLVQTGKALALLGGPVDAEPVGLIVTSAGLRPALQAALASIEADGTYQQVLATWGLQAAAVGSGR